MTRDEMFESVKTAVIKELEELARDLDDEVAGATAVLAQDAENLKELAVFCQDAEWSLLGFVHYVLVHSGWSRRDLGWLNPDEWTELD